MSLKRSDILKNCDYRSVMLSVLAKDLGTKVSVTSIPRSFGVPQDDNQFELKVAFE